MSGGGDTAGLREQLPFPSSPFPSLFLPSLPSPPRPAGAVASRELGLALAGGGRVRQTQCAVRQGAVGLGQCGWQLGVNWLLLFLSCPPHVLCVEAGGRFVC